MFKSQQHTRDVFAPAKLGMRHNTLRKANSKTVMRAIGFNPGVSNAGISRISGLAPQTVSAILLDLEDNGLIMRGDAVRGKRGQPATPISLHPHGGLAIGVEISWTRAEVLLLNLHAEVVQSHSLTYAYPDAHSLLDWIGERIEETLGALPPQRRKKVLDVGLAIPADLGGGMSELYAPEEQIALWREINPKAELARKTPLDITVFNDGNAACWSELIALSTPRPASIVYLLASDFLAAGIVGDGELWEGPTGHGADLGSMLVHPEGGGPLEAHYTASLLALRKTIGGNEIFAPFPPEWTGEGYEEQLNTWIAASARAMASVIFNTVTVLETPLVIIDSSLSRELSQRLATEVQTCLESLPVRRFVPPRVSAGKNGALASAIGAAELALYRRYF
ncbi:ROK family transcriptional regulator [Devosia sp. MC1541]|uniref:ROK family transcriptional regulator n=1 Tax=Devosia sp. MC1541 TaxID=2725264 RepID=UPI00145D1EA8|nr:ROK family transcriptional regulator [Devosia sp. MC1541]